MAVTELNRNTIQAAIKAIFEADTGVYDADSVDGTKANTVEQGRPNSKSGRPNERCYIYITQSRRSSRIINPKGSSQSNVFERFDNQLRFMIVFGTKGSDSQDTESKLNTLEKEILEALEADNSLSSTVDVSWPETVDEVPGHEGDVWQEREIVLFCKKSVGNA